MTAIDYFKNATEVETFAAGDTVFEAGELGDFMYAIQSGEVEIYFQGHLLDTVGTGGLVGEMGMVETRHDRSATVIAKTDCKLVRVDRNKFLFLVHETPMFALQVMQLMAQRLRHMNEVVS